MARRDNGYRQLMAFLLALLAMTIVLGILLAVRGSPSDPSPSPSADGDNLTGNSGNSGEPSGTFGRDNATHGREEPTAFRRIGPPENPLAVIRYYPFGGLHVHARRNGAGSTSDFSVHGLRPVRQLLRQVDLSARQQQALADMERGFIPEAMLDLNRMAAQVERAAEEWAYFERRGPDEDVDLVRRQFVDSLQDYARQAERLSGKYLSSSRSLLDEQQAGRLDSLAAERGYTIAHSASTSASGDSQQNE